MFSPCVLWLCMTQCDVNHMVIKRATCIYLVCFISIDFHCNYLFEVSFILCEMFISAVVFLL